MPLHTPCTEISPCHARRWMSLHTPCTRVSAYHARRRMTRRTPCTLISAYHARRGMPRRTPCKWTSFCDAHSAIPFHSRWLSLHSCQDISFLGSSAPSSQTYQRRAFQTGPPLPPQARTRRNRFRWVLLTTTPHRHGVCYQVPKDSRRGKGKGSTKSKRVSAAAAAGVESFLPHSLGSLDPRPNNNTA